MEEKLKQIHKLHASMLKDLDFMEHTRMMELIKLEREEAQKEAIEDFKYKLQQKVTNDFWINSDDIIAEIESSDNETYTNKSTNLDTESKCVKCNEPIFIQDNKIHFNCGCFARGETKVHYKYVGKEVKE